MLSTLIVAFALVSAGPRPPLALAPCADSAAAERVLCGHLTVAENRRTGVGRTIDLSVIVLPALEEEGKGNALFELAGGPGRRATEALDFYLTDGRDYRRHHDVVLVDQRGTGGSNPLPCARLGDDPQTFLAPAFDEPYVRACRAALETRADLTQYTTAIAMDDLDEVRRALGYERIDLIGLSYGTRAALVYLRRHGEHVGRVVLQSVAPTWARLPSHHAEAASRAMDLLLADCAAEASCARAYPRLGEDWQKALARLAGAPAVVETRQPDGTFKVSVTREAFVESVRRALHAPIGRAAVPRIVHHAAAGDFGPMLERAIPRDRRAPATDYDGTYLSVTCAEDAPFIDRAATARRNAANPFGNARVERQLRACELWPRADVPPSELEDVSSAAPVLILSGLRDPVTPPSWGADVARGLSHARVLEVPQSAHLPDGLDLACWDGVIVRFLDTGDPGDTRCLSTLRAPGFVVD